MSSENDKIITSDDDVNTDKASRGLKVSGIIALVIAVIGLGVVGMSVYFFVLSPSYVRNGMKGQQLDFPEIATESDASMYEVRPELASGTDATATDATATDGLADEAAVE